MGSCVFHITAVSYEILSHIHVVCLSSNSWRCTIYKPTRA